VNGWSHDVRDYYSAHSWTWPATIAAGALAVLLIVVWLTRSARRAGREKVISALINVAALMATAVQASGMWKFFGNTMGLPVGFRIFMFSFMEIALLACGLRARANVEEGGDAGIDGVLVWVLALASGLMSSTDANTVREGLMRVLVSVVVALLWTRDLMAAKQGARKAGGTGRPDEKVRWRFSVGALGVKLRLADPGNHGLADRDANRRIDNYVLAAHTANRDGAGAWAQRRKARAHAKLMRHARLHADPTHLMGLLGKAAFDEALELLGIEAEEVVGQGAGQAAAAAQPEQQAPRRQVVFGDRAEAAEAMRILMNGYEAARHAEAPTPHQPPAAPQAVEPVLAAEPARPVEPVQAVEPAEMATNRPAANHAPVFQVPAQRSHPYRPVDDDGPPTEIIRRPIDEIIAEAELFAEIDDPAPSAKSKMFAGLDELYTAGDERIRSRDSKLRNDAAREVARRIGGPSADRTVTRYATEWARAKGLDQVDVP
jgi:hypothetical protein